MSADESPGSAHRAGGPLRTWREHRQVRRAAERRRSTAQRDFNRLQREGRRELKGARRRAKTGGIVARAWLAEIGVRGIARLAASLRAGRAGRSDR